MTPKIIGSWNPDRRDRPYAIRTRHEPWRDIMAWNSTLAIAMYMEKRRMSMLLLEHDPFFYVHDKEYKMIYKVEALPCIKGREHQSWSEDDWEEII